MAVDASYMNLLPSTHLLTNREIIKSNQHHYQQQQLQQNQQQQMLNSELYNVQMDSAIPLQTTMHESMLPFYQSNVCDPNRADSGLTYNNPLQRKRSRDFSTELVSLPPHQKNRVISSESSPFLDQVLYQFQNQQSDIDRILAQHNEKVRMELEEQKMRQSRMLACVIQETIGKKLKEKDEEIQRIGKLNWFLQEKVKSLSAENQVWRELAQTNETTANYLRNNLEQVMAHVKEDHHHHHAAVAEDDAGSSCGSNNNNNNAAEDGNDTAATIGGGQSGGLVRMCKNCGVGESIVLLLPCRHLCLCNMCGSTVRKCPVCDSGIDASVHVNLS
jgi:E3 ubiquitin-protein ligase BOI-like protein